MIKVDNIDVWGFEHAVRGMRAKGYRRKNDKYETFVSVNGKSVSLGTYDTEVEAKLAVYNFREKRFRASCYAIGLNPEDGVEFEKNYIVFPNGLILNLHGKEMVGAVDRCGYREVIINGRQKLVHRIVAKSFIANPMGLEQINHINGDKLDNRVENLEWSTRSNNLLHAYRNGLEVAKHGEDHPNHKLTEDIVRYLRDNYVKGDREFSATSLGRRFGVDKSTIEDAVFGKTWGHVS